LNVSQAAWTQPVDAISQELLFHEKAVSDNGFCATRSHEFGEGGQQMYEEHDQVLHGKAE
jgi:hypothetical protein